jgi:hypothetical protein
MYPPGGRLSSSYPFLTIFISLAVRSIWMNDCSLSKSNVGTFGGMIKGMFGFGGKKTGGKEEL